MNPHPFAKPYTAEADAAQALEDATREWADS